MEFRSNSMSKLRTRSPADLKKQSIFETNKISLLIDSKATPRIHSASLTPYNITPKDRRKGISYESSISFSMKKAQKTNRIAVQTAENESISQCVDTDAIIIEKGKN